ncbi:MAG: carboxypeptidase regulatory-like domain-containing protein [Isosphaeraceae bacterium]
MVAHVIPMVAAFLAFQAEASVVVHGVVLDPRGKPLAKADVAVAVAALVLNQSCPILARTSSGAEGAFRLEVPRHWFSRPATFLSLWAYHPEFAVGVRRVEKPADGPTPTVSISLAEPSKRTFSVLGADKMPMAGVRLCPRLYNGGGASLIQTPDEWTERLTVRTDDHGIATLRYLPPGLQPVTMRVAGPGFASHTVPLAVRGRTLDDSLTLGHPSRLVGVIRTAEGHPVAGAELEVWAQNRRVMPRAPRSTLTLTDPPNRIVFDSGPVRTRSDGAFQTPPQLLTGLMYRVVVRHDGFEPAASDWGTLETVRSAVPPIRLRPLRKITGQIRDRAGSPVRGARVFMAGGRPSSTTDSEGRFALENVKPGRSFVLAEAAGFRFAGCPVNPASQSGGLALTVSRTSEPPERPMTTLPGAITTERSRALARRLLEPCIEFAIGKDDPQAELQTLQALAKLDPARTLELLQEAKIDSHPYRGGVLFGVAERLAVDDLVEAEAVLNSNRDPVAGGRVLLARALPASDRVRKSALLDRATVEIRAAPDGPYKISVMGGIADCRLDLGEVEKARALFRDALKMVEAQPPMTRGQLGPFLAKLARVEPDKAMSLIESVRQPATRLLAYAEAANALAIEHPGQAERYYDRLENANRPNFHARKSFVAMQLCRAMARSDAPRARRIAAALETREERACAWACLAAGLAGRDQAGAREALERAIHEIDDLLKPPTTPGQVDPNNSVHGGLVFNLAPAGAILPMVEKVDPDRVPEVFWRAVALVPEFDPVGDDFLENNVIAAQVCLFSRYDRQAASILFEPVRRATSGRIQDSSAPLGFPVVRAWLCLDPEAIVKLVEATPIANEFGTGLSSNKGRLALVEFLSTPSSQVWNDIWPMVAHVPLDE